MEQWEKEYLESLSARKNNKSKYTEGQREYINACWEEVTRPDGSKWYIPNQKVFDKEKKIQMRRYKRMNFFKKFGKVLLFFLLISDVLLKIEPDMPQKRIDEILTVFKPEKVSVQDNLVKPTIPVVSPVVILPTKPEMSEFHFEEGVISYEMSGGNFSSFWGTAEIETFTIKEVTCYSEILELKCEVVGTLTKGSSLYLTLKCFDADGFLLETEGLYGSVSVGERFKVTTSVYVPKGTKRIILSED